MGSFVTNFQIEQMLLNITQDKTRENRIWYKIRKQREEKGKGNKIMCKKSTFGLHQRYTMWFWKRLKIIKQNVCPHKSIHQTLFVFMA